jgi:hypothetical protein
LNAQPEWLRIFFAMTNFLQFIGIALAIASGWQTSQGPPVQEPSVEDRTSWFFADSAAFTFMQPEDWDLDILQLAERKFALGVYSSRAQPQDHRVVVVFDYRTQPGADLNQELEAEIGKDRKSQPGLKAEDLAVTHTLFRTAAKVAKVLVVPGKSYKYVVVVSVADEVLCFRIESAGAPATPTELATFTSMVQSTKLVLPKSARPPSRWNAQHSHAQAV